MRKRLVYFSISLAIALAAVVTQFSPPRAVAQQPPQDDPTEECIMCTEGCDLAFQACTAERGSRGPGFGQCMREQQECRRTCDGRGGPCNPQTDSEQTPAPTATPTPTPTPD